MDGNVKDLPRRTNSQKVLRHKAFEITSRANKGGYQRELVSMVDRLFRKNAGQARPETSQNQQLANELHKSIIRNFKKHKVYSSYRHNIWGADLAVMQLTSRYSNGVRFLLYVIDIYKKSA